MDEVFKALADPTRRMLLDRLFAEEGLTQKELEKDFEMTRFGIAKHLHILEEAGLVTTQRDGRVKRHFLNPIPIHQIHARWIDKYTAHQASALMELKSDLEDS
ncbi:MAG: helix-turn-helix transcriptional regulator [Propionibacterium sp.]|jgi:transcriptional regulator, ArsR family|nr:helix-turn-helix transcriptional regulator [Propionibacterium sp.]